MNNKEQIDMLICDRCEKKKKKKKKKIYKGIKIMLEYNRPYILCHHCIHKLELWILKGSDNECKEK